MNRTNPRLAAYACLALSMSLVGSYVALSKPLVATFPVFLLAWMRFAIGAAAMLRWLPRPAAEGPMSNRTRGLLFAEALLGNFLFSICMLLGMRLSSAVSAGVTMAAIPATVAVLSWVLLRERIALRTWLAIACSIGGISLLAVARDGAGPAGSNAWLGQALIVGAVLCEASYAVIGKSLTGVLDARRITALVNLWGLALMTPLGVWQALSFDFTGVALQQWALLVFYALAASVWSVWLWMTGLRHVPASQGGIFTVMLPVSATLVGVTVLDEHFGMLHAIAFGCALTGVLLATWPSRLARSR